MQSPTAVQLLAMSETERNAIMAAQFAEAANEDIELFDCLDSCGYAAPKTEAEYWERMFDGE